jgi:hypothetical protein
MTVEERTRMELWLSMARVYRDGKGKEMSNLRWINGAASKGLTTVSGDSKQAKQIGAHEALAHFMNAKRGGKLWTAEIAHNKWKNMKVSYKRVLKKFPIPDDAQWESDGKSKEEYASEVEKVTSARRAAFQSYDVLWKELKDHPSFAPSGQYESNIFDEDNEEDDDDEGAAGTGGEKTVTADDDREDGSASDDNASEEEENDKQSRHSSSKGSPRKIIKKKGKGSSKPVKMSLKKTSEQPRHRDITAAYISMKTEWNRMWLRTMMLKQRQDVYFMCLDRHYDRTTTNQILKDLGLNHMPAYMESWDEDVPNMHEATAAFRSADAIENLGLNEDGGIE